MDAELQQAFADLQKKTMESRTQVRIADVQINQLEREKGRAKLTYAEISSLPEDIRLFQSVGRMFLLGSKDEIEKKLKNDETTSDSKIKELEAKKKYLEKSVKESEENLREMLSQRRK